MRVVTRREDGKPRAVELDSAEQAANEAWSRALDQGFTIGQAVEQVRASHPGLGEDFYQWLSHPH